MRSHPFSASVIACVFVAGIATSGGSAPPQTVGEAGTREAAGHLSGGVELRIIERGDTLTRIGARVGVDPTVLALDNGLDARTPLRVGQTLRIDNRHVLPRDLEPGMVVINVPQRMLFYADDAGTLTFPVAIGRRSWRTPVGPFHIVAKEENPTWDVPRSILDEARRAGRSLPEKVPPGPDNPLGHYWLGLSIGGIGIHGTNAPSSVYRAATHGCVRLHPADIAGLFVRVTSGTNGRVIYEPVLLAEVGADVFLEVHPDVYNQRRSDARETVRRLSLDHQLTDRIDWAAADAVIAAQQGVARRVTRSNTANRGPTGGRARTFSRTVRTITQVGDVR